MASYQNGDSMTLEINVLEVSNPTAWKARLEMEMKEVDQELVLQGEVKALRN